MRRSLPSPAGPLSGPDPVRWDRDGLVPVVVQDAADGCVLMVAFANREALVATLETGEMHFFSRSRGRLWRKGETSGNVLRVRGLALDCDGDAILATVAPAGPACHRGTRTCFDGEGAPADAGAEALVWGGASARALASGGAAATPAQGFAWLEVLWTTIRERAVARPAGSYTARLLSEGVDGPARKVAEEAVEVLMAAKDDAVADATGSDRTATLDALAGEAADLLYHALVVLAERGLPPEAVIRRLQERHAR